MTLADIDRCDLVLFFRNSSPSLLKYLYYTKAVGKPIIYGVDDNFYELASSGRRPLEPFMLSAHTRFIELADTVLVYSNPMLEKASALNNHVLKVVPGIDLSIIGGIERKRHGDKLKVVYATSRYKNDVLFELFLPAVKRILAEYRGRVEMHFWGYIPEELFGKPGVYYLPEMDYETFLKKLYREGFDIGLAPLKNDVFHRSKTNTKFRDYGACRVAGIYSNVDVYSDCVEEGRTGLLVENTEDAWYGAIKRLADDGGLRQTLKENAYSLVIARYSMERVASELYEAIIAVLRRIRHEQPLAVKDETGRFFRKLKRNFLDVKTPEIRIISAAGEYPVIKMIKEIEISYGYPTVIENPRNEPADKDPEARIEFRLCEDRFADVRSPCEPSAITLANKMDDLYYGWMMKRDKSHIHYSLRPVWLRLAYMRHIAGYYIFKKTGLSKIGPTLRRKIFKTRI